MNKKKKTVNNIWETKKKLNKQNDYNYVIEA